MARDKTAGRDPFNDRYAGSNTAKTEETEETEETEKTENMYETESTSNGSKTSKPSKTEKTSKTSNSSKIKESKKSEGDGETDNTSKPVRERKNINMYIADDELVEDFQLLYAELNVAYRREHGEDMPKNDVFYPAVLKAALDGKDVKDVLDL